MIAINVDIAPTGTIQVIARPMGGIHEFGSIATGSDWATVTSYTVTDGAQFQLAKTLISCDQDVLYRLKWAGVVVSPEILVPASTPFPDWYPWDWETMEGDGSDALVLEAKYPSGGYAGTCHGEIIGEEY